MKRATIEDVRLIRGMIEELKRENLGQAGRESYRQKITELQELLNEYDFQPENALRRELELAAKRLDEELPKKIQIPKIEYVGIIEKKKIRLKRVFDHVFVERIYNRTIKLSWRFNEQGRIDLVDMMKFPENSVRNILKIDGFERIQKDWTSALAYVTPIPEGVNVVNQGFFYLSASEQYQSLMRFGHGTIKDVLEKTRADKCTEAPSRKEGQLNLTEILADDESLEILQRVKKILPTVYDLKKKSATVKYRPN